MSNLLATNIIFKFIKFILLQNYFKMEVIIYEHIFMKMSTIKNNRMSTIKNNR